MEKAFRKMGIERRRTRWTERGKEIYEYVRVNTYNVYSLLTIFTDDAIAKPYVT